ncbi:hypothetical protein K8T06_01690 [bacterium]|nr:hypothetical protein [bacterium]
MQSITHILHCDVDDVRDGLINLGARKGLIPSDDRKMSKKAKWTVGIFHLSNDWITVLDSYKCSDETASCLAHELQAFTLSIIMEITSGWSFSAFEGDKIIARYKWDIPMETLCKQKSEIENFEEQRLKDLGLVNAGVLQLGKGLNCPGRVISSDPRIEMNYRSRMSSGALTIPDPELDPELPRRLHKSTGMSTAARIRKILGTPHLNVEAAVAEFGFAMNFPNWIDECRIDDLRFNFEDKDKQILYMIEKK